MSYYEDIYTKRVNRFGEDFQSRIQGQREYAFDNYVKSSIYKTTFSYNSTSYTGTFEPYKQDETEILHYLLTQRSLSIPNGTILMLGPSNTERWMVYWKEEIKASGYNRYVMLKLTHHISYTKGNQTIDFWAYMYGQENNMLKDELKSRSRSSVLYNENLKLNFLVAPLIKAVGKEDYFVIHTTTSTSEVINQGYRVTGFDIISTPGVEYISVDPMYLKDETPDPTIQPGESEDDYFWIKSGE